MGHLSTHVLDIMRGKPASGVAIELHRLHDDGVRELVCRARTNADGRTDAPLLSGNSFVLGTYELSFDIGAYFAGMAVATPQFLKIVPIRFTLGEADGRYHVPLLASPFAYSTYRGS